MTQQLHKGKEGKTNKGSKWEEEWKKKVNELNKQSIKIHNAIYKGKDVGSEVVEFGYKIRRGNEIFTVTDWGNVKKFIHKTLAKERKEILDMAEDYLDDFGTFDFEGYGKRVIEELTKLPNKYNLNKI